MDEADYIARLFEAQHGLASRAQLLRLGISVAAIDWRLSKKEWVSVVSGVYRMRGVAPSWEQRVHAAMLWSSGAASHRSAARLWGLDIKVPDELNVDVITRMTRRFRGPGISVHRSRTIELADLTFRNGIRVTRLGMTLIHLAQVLGPLELEAAVDSAIRYRPRLLPWLTTRVQNQATRGLTGGAQLEHMVLARQFGTLDSLLEDRMKQLLERVRLSPTHVHYPLAAPFHCNLDFVWEPQRVAVSLMGIRDHGRRSRFDLDLTQLRELAARNWNVLPATWTDVHQRSGALIADLMGALDNSGVSLADNRPAWIFEPKQEDLFPTHAVDLALCEW